MKFISKIETKEPVYVIKQGDRFVIQGVEYILARVTLSKYCLVSLKDGNRWQDGMSMPDVAKQLNKTEARLIS